MSCFLTYWRLVVPTKSVSELEAELWLFLVALPRERFVTLPWVRFNRWHLVVVTFMNLFCIGSIFSNDFLDETIDRYFLGQPQNHALRAQLIGILAMGLTAALCGPFVESRGPRMGMAVGTGLLVCGWTFAHIGVITQVYQLLNLGCVSLLPDPLSDSWSVDWAFSSVLVMVSRSLRPSRRFKSGFQTSVAS